MFNDQRCEGKFKYLSVEHYKQFLKERKTVYNIRKIKKIKRNKYSLDQIKITKIDAIKKNLAVKCNGKNM